jgi:hypothetical protein
MIGRGVGLALTTGSKLEVNDDVYVASGEILHALRRKLMITIRTGEGL